jgi:hypothetical protein
MGEASPTVIFPSSMIGCKASCTALVHHRCGR